MAIRKTMELGKQKSKWGLKKISCSITIVDLILFLATDSRIGDIKGLYNMPASRGSRGSRGGARGRNPLPGSRSGGRSGRQLPSHQSSPDSSDGTTGRGGYVRHATGTSGNGHVVMSDSTFVTTSGRHRIIRGGHIGYTTGPGSSSRGGAGDPMGDLDGVFRQARLGDMDRVPDQPRSVRRLSMTNGQEDDRYDEDDDEDEDDMDHPSQIDSTCGDETRNSSQKKWISRVGEKFASSEVHKKVDARFDIIRNFPPRLVAHSVWKDLCDIWDSPEWKKKSLSGKKNRASADKGGKTSRHTGGSIGYDEHRIRLKRKWGREPSFKELFLATHLKKKSKARFFAGELGLNNLEELVFCTPRARQAYINYLEEMLKVYGPDFTEDDPDVWVRVQTGGSMTRVFGIGSSDLGYLVTGIPSSSQGLTPSYTEYRLSQQKVQKLEAQIQNQFEDERREREQWQQQIQQQFEETLQKQLRDFMEKFEKQPPSN
ncbi:hypothetical protein QVD17_40016 [Tagetes erecta]|uniref:Transposase, Ptta/En/Spm, plant n=1 Tax=Tagetes erecta TaxID=13708 RepID=A0AAD8JPK5_TARER|nr:hypothetical protein QVD17_40016 [Tagetes erecta]